MCEGSELRRNHKTIWLHVVNCGKVVQGETLKAMLRILNHSRSNGRYDDLSGTGHYQANGFTLYIERQFRGHGKR